MLVALARYLLGVLAFTHHQVPIKLQWTKDNHL